MQRLLDMAVIWVCYSRMYESRGRLLDSSDGCTAHRLSAELFHLVAGLEYGRPGTTCSRYQRLSSTYKADQLPSSQITSTWWPEEESPKYF